MEVTPTSKYRRKDALAGQAGKKMQVSTLVLCGIRLVIVSVNECLQLAHGSCRLTQLATAASSLRVSTEFVRQLGHMMNCLLLAVVPSRLPS